VPLPVPRYSEAPLHLAHEAARKRVDYEGRGCARLLRQLRSWRGGAAIAGSGALRCRDLARVTAAVSPRAQ
jgi:hypothetical protein